jgi:chromosome segregation ATPase
MEGLWIMDQALVNDNTQKKQEVLAYANRLSAALISKKRKTILEADTWKCVKELEYIKYKIDQKSKILDQTSRKIKGIEPRLAYMRKQFKQIEPEKMALEAEYERLLDIQINLNQKKIDAQHNQTKISELKVEIDKLKENINVFTGEIERLEADKALFAQQLEANATRVETLRTEIEVNLNSKKLMEGIKPESIDDADFQALMAGDQNAETYQADASDLIHKMKNEIAGMKSKLLDFSTREIQLTDRIDELEKHNDALHSQIQTENDTLSLKSEMDALAEKHAALSSKIDDMQARKATLNAELAEIHAGIEHENQVEAEYHSRMRHLQRRKAEIDALDDVEAHMQTLEAKISDIDRGIRANINFSVTLDGVKHRIDAIDSFSTEVYEKQRSAIIDYRQLRLTEAKTRRNEVE